MKLTERRKIGKATYGKISLLLLIICLFAICAPFSYLRADQKKNVLVLLSYHKGLEWTDGITQGIESSFHMTDQEIELFFEYMDTKRIDDAQHFQNLYELYRHKYRNRRFDVIISSDDHAFNFLLAHHKELFPNTPIVFCGVNDFKDSMLVGHNLITGVVESFDLRGSIDIALKLHPNTKEVFIIADKTLSATIVKEMMMKTIPYFEDVLIFTFLEELDMSEVLERVKDLSRDSIVFLISLLIDRSGNTFSFARSCALISQNSAAPIYSHSDVYLGHGIVGGMLNCGNAQGQLAGEMVSRILQGEKATNIPVVEKSPTRYMFDYQQMQRFGVDLSSLPEGSTVINKPYSFFSKYKHLVWSSIAGIASLVLIILILSANIITRRRAEEALRESEEKYRSLVESTEDSIYLVDKNCNYLFMNKKYLSRFGLPIDEILGRNYIDFHSEKGTKNFVERIRQVIESGESVFYEYKSERDGGHFIRTLSPVREPDGEINAVTVISKDITERKQAEEALRHSTEKLSKEHNQRKMLSKRLIELLEKERLEIAMELHDHIGQTLASLKMNLEMIRGQIKPAGTKLESQIIDAEEKAIQALKDIRNVSHGLRPPVIDTLGLVSSLRELFNETQQQTDFEIQFFSRGIPERLEAEKELAIYRIAQEALNNIIKHARAKNVYVNLTKKDENLSLSVEDDGVGFDLEKAMKATIRKGPLGLLIMRERVEQLGGEFTIDSQVGKGTHVLVEIPL